MAENAGATKSAKFRKNFVKFFRDIRSELKKVIWPTRKQLINNTVTVLLACLVVGVIIWVADGILTKVVEAVMK